MWNRNGGRGSGVGGQKGLTRLKRALRMGLWVVPLAVFVVACRQDMHNQPKYKPLRASNFFEDGQSSRPLVAGTVPRGYLRDDAHLYAGRMDGAQRPVSGKQPGVPPSGQTDSSDVDTFPFPITREILYRGRERFNITCSPCHGRLGNGEGMVVRRGFRQPPSFHIDRLREAPVGHFFDVMTNGFGAMPDYANQTTPQDRWAIVAYIRALQLSQHATLADVPPEERDQLIKEGKK